MCVRSVQLYDKIAQSTAQPVGGADDPDGAAEANAALVHVSDSLLPLFSRLLM